LRANEDIALIEHAVREAGEIARHYYGKEYRRWSKSRGEPVTEADIAIDKFLRGTLEKARPDYGWLSEETGKNLSRLNTERMFIVDPIDGTTAFLKERPHFSISIGIAEKGRAVAGVVYNPILDECFAAFSGGGARLNGANRYTVTFAKDQTPPVNGFWSLTLYNQQHFFAPNAIGRYSIGSKNKDLKYGADGSLTLYVQADPPPDDQLANWLPTPKQADENGDFSLYLRAYWPKAAVLEGAWTPPPVENAD